jgi:hypothetical protein
MVHIVFQQSDVDTLKKAIELDESLNGEIVEIKDELAVGPIADIFTEEGHHNRVEWWRRLLEFSPYVHTIGSFDDRETVRSIREKLSGNEDEPAWIWVAPNQHDVCGYFWLISQLKEYAGRIFVLSLNNLPFINEKGSIFYPINVFDIPPKEFLKAKKLARPVTLSEFELDSDEWKKLYTENAMVRILEGGKKVLSRDASYYDDNIMNAITAEPQKLNKIFHTLFAKMKLHTGDAFLAWRMRELINDGRLEAIGEWKNGWKEMMLKTPAVSEEGQKPELDIIA